jgi:hypothetical protein
MREMMMFRKQMEEVERLPLAERKENAMEWFKDLSDNYMMVAERVGWLLNGSYGKGSFDSACRVVNSPRMNQVAWCAITIANLEWRCPAKMAIMSWKKLPVETRYQVNEAIRREIADAKAEGYCGEIKKNPSDGRKQIIHTMNYVEVEMPMRAIMDLSASGSVDDSADYWSRNFNVKIRGTPDQIRKELKQYGAWSEDELSDDKANRKRLLWVASGDMMEEYRDAM